MQNVQVGIADGGGVNMTLIEMIQDMDEQSALALDVIMDNLLDNNGYDKKFAHRDADIVLHNLLETLGCEKTIKAWDAISKWYT